MKYWVSTLPKDIAFDRPIDLTKLRWRIERDYQELKQEVGLGHYEGRDWRGFHRHATLCIAAYGFLISEERDNSPLRTMSRREVHEIYRTRRSPTQARLRSGRIVTSQTRSPRCDDGSPSPSPG